MGLSTDLTMMNSRSLSLTAGRSAVQAATLGCIQKADLAGFCMCERFKVLKNDSIHSVFQNKHIYGLSAGGFLFPFEVRLWDRTDVPDASQYKTASIDEAI